jgi:alkaline phosphatase D
MRYLLLILFVNYSFTLFAQKPHQNSTRSDVNPLLEPFYHGVASGDPLSDRVILWTRVTTDQPTVEVTWQVATDTLFNNIVIAGTASTDASKDFTVKVDAVGLQPNTWYYYRFLANGISSLMGRTRTAPATPVSQLRFAIMSCSNHQDGFFNAYRDVVTKNEVDAVVHLGDYIYEYGISQFASSTDSSRMHKPANEALNLADYRIRHSQYKLDPDLREIHRQFPFIAVWDDHETANDAWVGGAQNHTEPQEGLWENRKNAGRKAYFEWMPVRDYYNSSDTIRRYLDWGGLVEFIMLDTRLEGREQQIGVSGPAVNDTNRTMLGKPQYNWFINKLGMSTARWKLIGNQVMISPLRVLGSPVNQDQWDGYPAERFKILSYLNNNSINNTVFLTGDIHTSWANDVPLNINTYNATTGAGSVAVEMVCTSITATSFVNFTLPLPVIRGFNPHVKYAELSKRGYVVLDVDTSRVQGDWIHLSTVQTRNFTSNVAASLECRLAENRLRTASSALPPRVNPPKAPEFVITKNSLKPTEKLLCLVLAPNPAADRAGIQLYTPKGGDCLILLTDVTGKISFRFNIMLPGKGVHEWNIPLQHVPAGKYMLQIQHNNERIVRQLIKE